MLIRLHPNLYALLICGLVAGTSGRTAETPGLAPDFQKEILPIFEEKCIRCHGSKRRGGKLDMRTLDAMLEGGVTGPAIQKGNARKSLLIELIHYKEMPPKKESPRVTISELDLLRRWIDTMPVASEAPSNPAPEARPMKTITRLLILSLVALFPAAALAQTPEPLAFRELFNGKDLTGWVDVNTSKETWTVKDGLLVCAGQPIGVMRSEKQYENFILHIEWRHMKAGGNSGVFIWSEGTVPSGNNLPKGMEVQMLELQWPVLNPDKDGNPRPAGYVSGELFGANGLETTPDNPRGRRSQSVEMRCLGKGEWNTYDVVAVDGVVKLAINGKFVNGVSKASVKKGYLCLESEGSEIHFRHIRIMELPPGVTAPEQSAAEVEK